MLNDKSLCRALNSSLNKNAINRLLRIYRHYRGACARLASQKNMLAAHSAHQNRLFANALLESLSFHLLYSSAPLKAELPSLSPSGKALPELMARLSDLNLSEDSGCLPEAEAALRLNNGENDFYRLCRLEDLKNEARSFIGAAEALGLKSRERVNFICLHPSEGAERLRRSENPISNLQRLTRIRQKRELTQEKGAEAVRQLQACLRQLESYDSSSVRILADSRFFSRLCADGAASQPLLKLPGCSKIFIHYEQTAPPDYDQRLRLKLALSEIFLIKPQCIYDIWTNSSLHCSLISCQAGYFHLPVTLRLSADGLCYNPCIFSRPILAKQTSIQADSRLFCPCGIKAPIVK